MTFSATDAEAIHAVLRLIVEDLAPQARYLPKYGGLVIAPTPDSDRFVGGIYTYSGHVSLEFSQGASFDDPDAMLEGKGKMRRHLKFRSSGDVMAKGTEGFLRQALAGAA
ncbi:DUF1801 domain-containing protein [Phaeobacter sp. HF9A]|uniref:DUF1801 domain-containing protein n=1 Tax=Phaeobacter sp. HF9A TaxID=2721561 RepID=UPI00143205A2|nr:DUF1801 domain-containing protein [Phaeobacter sp. HF9A]NIZ14369.1 DUF1801 domain-containing protein [Phaeobacter sp. HF9A]